MQITSSGDSMLHQHQCGLVHVFLRDSAYTFSNCYLPEILITTREHPQHFWYHEPASEILITRPGIYYNFSVCILVDEII